MNKENDELGKHPNKKNVRTMRYRTKEEAMTNKNKGDRLFYDQFINEYFTISQRKKQVWKEDEFEENFIMMPETFEECMKLSAGHCHDCEHLPNRHGNFKSCLRRALLLRRENMEVF